MSDVLVASEAGWRRNFERAYNRTAVGLERLRFISSVQREVSANLNKLPDRLRAQEIDNNTRIRRLEEGMLIHRSRLLYLLPFWESLLADIRDFWTHMGKT